MSDPDKKLQARGGDMDARVKPLVWHKSKTTNWNDDWHTVPTGYTVRCADENGWKWATPLGSFGYASSPNGAKEAAQQDHEARICWALEPAPDLAELVEAAKPFALLDETDDSIGDFCEKHPVEGKYVADLRAALTKLGVR